MKLLLDTHVAIWAVLGSRRLPSSIEAMIADPANDVSVSIVSLWEIALKNNRASGGGTGVSATAAIREFAAASFAWTGIEQRHVLAVERLPLHHRDPFDRMLVAQAIADGYRLVTHDRALAAYGEAVLLV